MPRGDGVVPRDGTVIGRGDGIVVGAAVRVTFGDGIFPEEPAFVGTANAVGLIAGVGVLVKG